jgi:hypothetical protein
VTVWTVAGGNWTVGGGCTTTGRTASGVTVESFARVDSVVLTMVARISTAGKVCDTGATKRGSKDGSISVAGVKNTPHKMAAAMAVESTDPMRRGLI